MSHSQSLRESPSIKLIPTVEYLHTKFDSQIDSNFNDQKLKIDDLADQQSRVGLEIVKPILKKESIVDNKENKDETGVGGGGVKHMMNIPLQLPKTPAASLQLGDSTGHRYHKFRTNNLHKPSQPSFVLKEKQLEQLDEEYTKQQEPPSPVMTKENLIPWKHWTHGNSNNNDANIKNNNNNISALNKSLPSPATYVAEDQQMEESQLLNITDSSNLNTLSQKLKNSQNLIDSSSSRRITRSQTLNEKSRAQYKMKNDRSQQLKNSKYDLLSKRDEYVRSTQFSQKSEYDFVNEAATSTSVGNITKSTNKITNKSTNSKLFWFLFSHVFVCILYG